MATFYGNSTGAPGVTFYVVIEYNQQEFVTSGSYTGKYHFTVNRYVYVSENNGAGTWSRTFRASWTGDTIYTMSSVGEYASSSIDIYLSPNESQSFSYNAGYRVNDSKSYTSTCANTFTAPSKTFTITYNGNGGLYNGSPTWSESVTYGVDYKTWDNFFTRSGYTFIGWNEKADGTGTDWTTYINKNWTWVYARDATVYAIWRPNTLSIQYNVNSGLLNSDSYSVNSDGYITGLEEPHAYIQTFNYGNTMTEGLLMHDSLGLYKLGYKFIGWSLGTEDTENLFDDTKKDYSVTDFSNDVESEDVTITLYAQWKIQNVGYIQIDNVPQLALIYYKENGTWNPAIGYRKIDGSYKQSMA